MLGSGNMKLIELLKIIAHPIRFNILECLFRSENSVKKLAETLNKRQSNISQHLGILRQAGLVSFRKQGKQRIYKLNPNHYQFLTKLFQLHV